MLLAKSPNTTATTKYPASVPNWYAEFWRPSAAPPRPEREYSRAIVLLIPNCMCSPNEYTNTAAVTRTLFGGITDCMTIPASMTNAPILKIFSALNS